MARGTNKHLYLPELIELGGRAWDVEEVSIRDAAVDTQHAKAFVPKPHTPAQKLARLHEGGHIKYSPRNWVDVATRVMTLVGDERADFRACLKLSKMLEENRIDWKLWDEHNIDLRPAREVLDWAMMPDPGDLLAAAGMVLQLAWTVWASRGLSKGIPNEPPARVPDTATGEYFDKAWKMVVDEDIELGRAIIKGCLTMYADPSDDTRDRVAAELATYFLREEEEEEEQPPVKEEEREKQEQAEKEEEEAEAEAKKEETGVGSEITVEGGIEYHDHTARLKRPSVRIVRRSVPVSQGVAFRYANRYLIDKNIFAQRRLTEAGIMIDGSGSMSWTNDDMRLLMDKLPAVMVGLYSGTDSPRSYGRICTLAKGGRFSRFEGLDEGMNGGNDVDYEALKLLAKWPAPRLWLSDGLVCGGRYARGCAHSEHATGWHASFGLVVDLCDQVMKAHQIMRVPNADVMHRLLKRERVTLYRSCRSGPGERHDAPGMWADSYRTQPVTFQL
jgi:hypothetical protein